MTSRPSSSRPVKGEKQGSPPSGTKKFQVQPSDIVSTTAHMLLYSSSSMPAACRASRPRRVEALFTRLPGSAGSSSG